MATKRSVILKGTPTVNEDGAASAEVRPGYLVKGVTTIAHQTVSNAPVPKAFALEREELGRGFDNTYQSAGQDSAYYASGDTVKVGVFRPGDVVTAWIASGQNIQADELLESAGDGTLKSGSTALVGRSLDEIGAVTVLTPLRVEIM